MAKVASNSLQPSHDPTALGREFLGRMKGDQVLLGATAAEFMRPSLVKLYKYAGYDFIYLENEHTLFNGADLSSFVLSARDNGMPVIAKTGQLERAEVARLLDAGVVGIQLPRTESREDVKTLIDYVKYPPMGSRAGAPSFGNMDYAVLNDHGKWLNDANESIAVIAHIETARGYANAEQIISTPQLNMVYLGPYDFSIAMGHPGDYDHDAVRKPMLEMLQLCHRHGVACGTTPSGLESAAQWAGKGVRFFELRDELSLLSEAAAREVQGFRKAVRP